MTIGANNAAPVTSTITNQQISVTDANTAALFAGINTQQRQFTDNLNSVCCIFDTRGIMRIM